MSKQKTTTIKSGLLFLTRKPNNSWGENLVAHLGNERIQKIKKANI